MADTAQKENNDSNYERERDRVAQGLAEVFNEPKIADKAQNSENKSENKTASILEQAKAGVTEQVAIKLKTDESIVTLAALADVSIKPPATDAEYLKIAEQLITERKFEATDINGNKVTVAIADIDKTLKKLAESSPDYHKEIIEKLGANTVDEKIPDAKKRETIAKSVADGIGENTGFFAFIANIISAIFDWLGNGKSGDGLAGLKESIANVNANKAADSVASKLESANIGLDKDTIKEIAESVHTKISDPNAKPKVTLADIPSGKQQQTTDTETSTDKKADIQTTQQKPTKSEEQATRTAEKAPVSPERKPIVSQDIIDNLRKVNTQENKSQHKQVKQEPKTQENTQPSVETAQAPTPEKQPVAKKSSIENAISGIATKLITDSKDFINMASDKKNELLANTNKVIKNTLNKYPELKDLLKAHYNDSRDPTSGQIVADFIVKELRANEVTNERLGKMPDAAVRMKVVEIMNKNRTEIQQSLAYGEAGVEKKMLAGYNLGNNATTLAMRNQQNINAAGAGVG